LGNVVFIPFLSCMEMTLVQTREKAIDSLCFLDDAFFYLLELLFRTAELSSVEIANIQRALYNAVLIPAIVLARSF